MLPRPRFPFLIIRKRVEPRSHWTGAARRAQPHVDFVEHAVIGARRKGTDQSLRETREILPALQRARAIGIRLFVIKVVNQDQIEIG